MFATEYPLPSTQKCASTGAFLVVPRAGLLYCFLRVAKPNRGKRIGQILAIVFAIVLMVDAVVGDRGLLAQRRAAHEYEGLTRTLELKRMENARLQEEARRLKNDPSAIEELARRELGLIRPGEKVFIVKDLKTTATH